MATVQEHYDQLLAEIYTWAFGGFEETKYRNEEFFRSKNITPDLSGIALDLGAGAGAQSIPLAEAGFAVTAIDLNEEMLQELSQRAFGLEIITIQDDMLNLQNHCDGHVELIVCMTDTITHLDSQEKVIKLFEKSYNQLETNGQLILTFRDLTHELTDLERFIHVKSNRETIFTCFLEYEPETVKVHDVVYQNINGQWELKKSFYRKIKLSQSCVEAQLTDIGFQIELATVENGFVTVIAKK